MKTWEDSESVYYEIGCDCRSSDHNLQVNAESDKDSTLAALNFGVTLHTRWQWNRFKHPLFAWLNEPLKRISIASEILFRGRSEYYYEFILGEDNIKALRYALDEIEKKFK